MTEHTALPWRYNESTGWIEYAGVPHYSVGLRLAESTAKANAAFIVRAVNAHDELVAALPDVGKLRTLATWLDLQDDKTGLEPAKRDVQADLRRWADAAAAALASVKVTP